MWIVLALVLMFVFTPLAHADEGGSYFRPLAEMPYYEDGGGYSRPLADTPYYAADGCESVTSWYDPGKTEEGFSAKATDGCHTVEWTSNTTDVTGSGKLTFKTVGNVYPWENGYNLPGPQGGNYCQYRAANEANAWMTNRFKVPVGTEVTVSYRCY